MAISSDAAEIMSHLTFVLRAFLEVESLTSSKSLAVTTLVSATQLSLRTVSKNCNSGDIIWKHVYGQCNPNSHDQNGGATLHNVRNDVGRSLRIGLQTNGDYDAGHC